MRKLLDVLIGPAIPPCVAAERVAAAEWEWVRAGARYERDPSETRWLVLRAARGRLERAKRDALLARARVPVRPMDVLADVVRLGVWVCLLAAVCLLGGS